MQTIEFNNNWYFKKKEENTVKSVILPHDAMLHEKRDPSCESGSSGAYFPGGVYEYEKRFDVPDEWNGKQVLIRFEGVYRNAEICINDIKVGDIVYGYTEGVLDLSGYLNYGAENKISVYVDNADVPNSRWYSGSGIYRPVTLYILEPEHIELDGVKIVTLSYEPAKILVTVAHRGGTPVIEIMDRDEIVASGTGDRAEMEVLEAKLWSEESPHLYTCKVTLFEENTIIDEREVDFGIRKVEWSPKGLFVNGKETLLRGGCVHHDNGILGACAYVEAEERRVRIMKENGFNAIRSAHNPCSRAMLEACDRYGMYVMDETWDMWYQHKSKCDYASEFMEHYHEDIRSMVEKDYNHPSVIMYSIGNEISEPAKEEGMTLAKEMIEFVHKLDDSRAVTAGLNLMIVANSAKGKEMYNTEGGLNLDASGKNAGEMNSTQFNMMTQMIGPGMNNCANSEEADKATSPILDALDIAGYNYASGRYPLEGKAHPNRVIFGSETFPHDIKKNWDMVEKYPYLIGDFMWTAWDYLGEAGIGAWSYTEDAMDFNKPYPWLTGGAGVIDLIGNPDGEALYAKAVWRQNKETGIAVTPANHPGVIPIHSAWRGTNAIPSWSWNACNGNPVSVEVYTNAPKVSLFINGKLLGEKDTEECKCIFDTVYEPGVLEAIGYDENGQEIERGSLSSANGPYKICIQPEEKEVRAGGLIFVHVNICGENNIVESNADELLTVNVEGGELLGFGSAAQRTEEDYLAGKYTAYYGRTLAVVRAGTGEKIYIRAKGIGLAESSIEIPVVAD